MNKNKGIAPIIIVLIVALLVGGGFGVFKIYEKTIKLPPEQQIVGGDRDAHGCIGSAGYSWCEVKSKCLRIWEEKCEVPATTSAVDTKDWKVYKNDKYGFELKYPREWEVNDKGAFITFGNPLSGLKVFHFNISVESNPNRLSAQAYAENFVKGRRAEIERDGGVGIVRYDREFTTNVGNLNAYEFENYFNFDQSSERIYVTQGSHVFVFEFPVAEENLNLNKPIDNNVIVHQILPTFKFTDTLRVSPKPCMVTGCSSQICADENVISTCEYRPEYVCYKSAKCERQATGKCGWTESAVLSQCLKSGRTTE